MTAFYPEIRHFRKTTLYANKSHVNHVILRNMLQHVNHEKSSDPGYNKMLTKLKMKQEHLKDIQDALATADINNDKALDWEEWRNDLRARGIPDNEIEAVFAKYDTDGDMVLNEDEQKALARDLEQSRRDIDEKMGKIDKSSSDAVKDANKVAMPIGGVSLREQNKHSSFHVSVFCFSPHHFPSLNIDVTF